MTRVALYARYSSDQQRAASIPDQLRDCREYATRQGWMIVQDFHDAAVSGASLLRPGFQALMRGGLAGAFDVVLAESLDRFSRDQEDTAGLFKRLTFAGVRIITLSEGEIGAMAVGFKGTMNALFLKDLAEKVRRGMRGRVELGKSGGGVSYGYTVVRVLEGQPRGDREIHPAEAEIVRRVFQEFVNGASTTTIAKRLNAEGVPSPTGTTWYPSVLQGTASTASGILNNELYIGRLVWNRQRYLKDPETGRRQKRLNPPEAQVISEVPHLRIIDQDVWQAVKARQAITRRAMALHPRPERHRRPKYLFSGLTACGACGGAYVMYSHDHLACAASRERGTCTNRVTIRRDEIEDRVLAALREKLMDPRRFARASAAFVKTINRLRREQRAGLSGMARELAAADRQIQEIIRAIKDGLRTPAMKAELLQLEARRATLAGRLEEQPLPTLHPGMAELYRAKVTALCTGLAVDGDRDVARAAIRGLIDRITLQPAARTESRGRQRRGKLDIMVYGNLAAMLNMASGRKKPADLGFLTNASNIGCGGPPQPLLADLCVGAA